MRLKSTQTQALSASECSPVSGTRRLPAFLAGPATAAPRLTWALKTGFAADASLRCCFPPLFWVPSLAWEAAAAAAPPTMVPMSVTAFTAWLLLQMQQQLQQLKANLLLPQCSPHYPGIFSVPFTLTSRRQAAAAISESNKKASNKPEQQAAGPDSTTKQQQRAGAARRSAEQQDLEASSSTKQLYQAKSPSSSTKQQHQAARQSSTSKKQPRAATINSSTEQNHAAATKSSSKKQQQHAAAKSSSNKEQQQAAAGSKEHQKRATTVQQFVCLLP
ncbi:hypothetical protein, conserved [Eimeria tenella]|uniref:Uncharacterized protein n=1 Tax=Eimeria tenella TaxID=5802 RepID=U6L1E1_EIMTE|nr:hypothetical protein, conserved [Eimeria tenella]CDJ43986.1 hypothetical protein, conserved [Eimeria tenella]|eukprot:XP_013234735.1 hypothetical protein, conserved [Eimeria tenella]